MNIIFLIFDNQDVLSPLLAFLGFSLGGGRMGFPGGTVVKNPPTNARDARDAGSIPGSERSPGEGHGNPLQYSHLENLMERGTWWAVVHGITKS